MTAILESITVPDFELDMRASVPVYWQMLHVNGNFAHTYVHVCNYVFACIKITVQIV